MGDIEKKADLASSAVGATSHRGRSNTSINPASAAIGARPKGSAIGLRPAQTGGNPKHRSGVVYGKRRAGNPHSGAPGSLNGYQ